MEVCDLVELNVYTKGGEALGVLDKFTSLIWTRKLYEPSTFEVEFIVNAYTAQLAKVHNIVEKSDTRETCYVKSIKIKQDLERGTLITMSGEGCTSIMYNRLVRNQSTTVLGYFRANVLDCPDYYYRETPAMTIPILPHASDPAVTFAENENLGEVTEVVLRQQGLGLKSTWGGGYSLVDIVSGKNRSIGQSINPQVVFSTEFDNLVASEYSSSSSGIITSCFVRMLNPDNWVPEYGATITEDELVGYTTGIDRIETHTTCEAISRIGLTGKTYLDTEATKVAMRAAGEAMFRRITENFTGQVRGADGYRTEWDLGDIVTVENKAWGTSVNEHVTEVCEVFDSGGFRIEPTFGERTLNITDLLKFRTR